MPTSHRAEQERKKKPAPYQEMADANIPYLPGPLRRHFLPTETRVMAVIQKSYIRETVAQTRRVKLRGYLRQRDIFKCFGL